MQQPEVSRASRLLGIRKYATRGPLAMVAIALLTVGCQSTPQPTPAERAAASLPASVPLVTTPRNWPDSKSYADPLSFVTRSFDLDLDVDFEDQSAAWQCDARTRSRRPVGARTRARHARPADRLGQDGARRQRRLPHGSLRAGPARRRTRQRAAHRHAAGCRTRPYRLCHLAAGLRPAVAAAVADRRQAVAVPVQPGPGAACAIDGAAAGHALDSRDLHRDVAGARRPRRSHGGRGRPGQSPRTDDVPLPHAAADSVVPAGTGGRRSRIPCHRSAHRCLGRAVESRRRSEGVRRRRGDADDSPRRSTVRTAGVGTTC